MFTMRKKGFSGTIWVVLVVGALALVAGSAMYFVFQDNVQDNECDEMAEGSFGRGICYMELAEEGKDIELCQKASPYEASCAVAVDADKDNSMESLDAVCDVLVDRSSNKEMCYMELAEHREYIEFCEKAGSYASSCAINVDSDKDNSIESLDAVCDVFEVESFNRGMCYLELAEHRGHVEFCEKAESYMDSCYDKF